MSAAADLRPASDYRDWQLASATIGATRFRVATKPGLLAHGRPDVASQLLAQHIQIAAGDVLLCMNCGSGLLGAVAGMRDHAAQIHLTDRNVVSAEAARRTMHANGVEQATVHVAHGAQSLPVGIVADVVAIRIPHEKLALHQLLRDAALRLQVDGRCYVAGANQEGIRSAAQVMEQLFGNARVVAHDSGHRIVVAIKRSSTLPESIAANADVTHPLLDANAFHEVSTELRGAPIVLYSRPGVFSWDHADEATELLASVMDVRAGESVLDLGCGAGGLGVVAARLSGTGRVTMLDADIEAVRSATRTAKAAGVSDARVLGSDVADAVRGEQFDVVVTNPPFHVGKNTELSVPLQFIEEAWEVLAPHGRMYLVANRTLPYERVMQHRFGNLTTVHDGQRFKVLLATKHG